MKRIALSVCLLAMLAVADAAAETQTMNFTNFEEISAESALRLSIRRGDTYQVTASAEPEDLKRLEAKQDGTRLRFSLRPASRVGPIMIDITMPMLRRLSLSSAASGRLMMAPPSGTAGDGSAGPFTVRLSSAATVAGEIGKRDDVDFNLAGASRIALTGSVGAMRLMGAGASQFNLKDLIATGAVITLSAASSATVTVNGKIDATLSSASRLIYYGNATLSNQSTSGASSIHRGS